MSYQLPEPAMTKQVNAFTKEVMDVAHYTAQQLQDAFAKGREAGLLEAANKAENASSTADGADIAEAIRALIKEGEK